MIVADSDVLIDFLRGRGEGARRVAIELETRSFATTAITAFEIRSGARTARQKRAVDILLEALEVRFPRRDIGVKRIEVVAPASVVGREVEGDARFRRPVVVGPGEIEG